MALLAEVALLRSQGAKAEQRIGVLESEVVALMAQAEQSSYEHELAQKVQHFLPYKLPSSTLRSLGCPLLSASPCAREQAQETPSWQHMC